MDQTDKQILNIIQKRFPVTAEPFKAVAEEIGISEKEVIDRVRSMKHRGIIRRIGAVFDARKLGFASTLCAAAVPEEHLKSFVKIVNAHVGVTHHYRRNHAYNVWFTLIAPSEEALREQLADIRDRTGITDILDMRASRMFKIDASFDL